MGDLPPGRFLAARDGTSLHFLHWPAAEPPARAVVVYLHGIAGHAGGFGGIASYLVDHAVAVYGLDRRGSGNSGGVRGHLRRFEDALDDLAAMLNLAASEQPESPLFLAASSWAAKLAAIYVAQRSGSLAGLVLLAPVFVNRANLSLLQRLGVLVGGRLLPRWRVGMPVRPEMATGNASRWESIRDDPLRLRSATAGFYWETVRMDRRRTVLAPSIRLPILVLQGEADPIPDIAATRDWLASVGSSDTSMVIYPGAGHVLDLEPEPEQFRADLLEWVLDRAPARTQQPPSGYALRETGPSERPRSGSSDDPTRGGIP